VIISFIDMAISFCCCRPEDPPYRIVIPLPRSPLREDLLMRDHRPVRGRSLAPQMSGLPGRLGCVTHVNMR
jgi:hypothetical protein